MRNDEYFIKLRRHACICLQINIFNCTDPIARLIPTVLFSEFDEIYGYCAVTDTHNTYDAPAEDGRIFNKIFGEYDLVGDTQNVPSLIDGMYSLANLALVCVHF